jgi:hypothetical protein
MVVLFDVVFDVAVDVVADVEVEWIPVAGDVVATVSVSIVTEVVEDAGDRGSNIIKQ